MVNITQIKQGIQNIFKKKPKVSQEGKIYVTSDEVNSGKISANSPNVSVVQSSTLISSVEKKGGGGSDESADAIGQAQANEIEIQNKLDVFKTDQEQFYQKVIQSKINNINNFNSLSKERQQAIINQEVETAQTQFNNALQVYYKDLREREIARREEVPYFKKQADELKKGVIWLNKGEFVEGNGISLSIPTSFEEERLLNIVQSAKSSFKEPTAEITFIAGSTAVPLTTSENFHLEIARRIGADTSKIMSLREIGASRPEYQKTFGWGLNRTPSIAQLLIVAERIENLKGIPLLIMHPSQITSVPSAILSDLKDYGKLAITSPVLFRTKFLTDVGLFYAISGLGKLVKTGGTTLKVAVVGEKTSMLKFIGFESILKSSKLSLSVLEFEKGNLRGYVLGVTKPTGKNTSISYVIGKAGEIDISKLTPPMNKASTSLLAHPELLSALNKITFGAIQFNKVKGLPKVVFELKNLDTGLTQTFVGSLKQQTSIGLLRQFINKKIIDVPFFSRGLSSTSGKITTIGGISKNLLTKELTNFYGKLAKVKYEIETAIPKDAYFTFTKTPKTSFKKTFPDVAISDISASSQKSVMKANLLEKTNLASLSSAVANLKVPSNPISTITLPKFPIPKLTIETKQNSQQRQMSFQDQNLNVRELQILSPRIMGDEMNRERNRTTAITNSDVLPRVRYEQTNVVLQKNIQSQQSRTLLITKLLLKTPQFTTKGFAPKFVVSTKGLGLKDKMKEGRTINKKSINQRSSGTITKTSTFTARELNALRIKL